MVLNKNINFYVIKVKRNVFTLIFILFTISLIVFSSNSLTAVRNGLSLWTNSVLPSLFPFFVATELLMHTNFVSILGRLLNNIMRPIFNISGEGSFALIMGLISGYPVGAKIAADLREKNICSKEECERLLSFTNNSGPLFIIGTVGVSMYHSTTIGLLLFISHFLGCLCVGILFRFWKPNKKIYTPHKNKPFKDRENTVRHNASLSNLGEVLYKSISSSIKTVVIIGGFIVLFSCIISILQSIGIVRILSNFVNPIFTIFSIDNAFSSGLICGIIEVTNGINYISTITIKELSINLILTSFLLGLGGISILLQVLSITSTSDLSIKPYIYGKFLHGVFSSVFTLILILLFPCFNFNLI